MSLLSPNEYIDRLRDSRFSPAVLKLKLAQIRADAPNTVVVAFEGADDKLVYRQWIRRISDHFVYEPLVGRGKKQVLDFRSALTRDRTGLNKNVYFIVDKDFDRHEDDEFGPELFVACRHSVENYLVGPTVLNSLLTDVFHFEGRIADRKLILDAFLKAYDSFLLETKDLNWRLFLSARLNFKTVKHLPDSIGKIVKIDLFEVVSIFSSAEEVVVFDRPLVMADAQKLRPEFDLLDGKLSYRGKFALLFFQAWLGHLAELFSSGQLESAIGVSATGKPRREQLIISSYASVSEVPEGLSDFVQMMEAA